MYVCLLFHSVLRNGDKGHASWRGEAGEGGDGTSPLLVASNSCCHQLDFLLQQVFLE